MGRTACTEPQCLYKGDLNLYTNIYHNTNSLYNVHSYMFRHRCVILREFQNFQRRQTDRHDEANSCLFAILQTPRVVLHLQTTSERPDTNVKRRLKQCHQLYTSQMTEPLFRDMTPCRLVVYRRFGRAYCLHL